MGICLRMWTCAPMHWWKWRWGRRVLSLAKDTLSLTWVVSSDRWEWRVDLCYITPGMAFCSVPAENSSSWWKLPPGLPLSLLSCSPKVSAVWCHVWGPCRLLYHGGLSGNEIYLLFNESGFLHAAWPRCDVSPARVTFSAPNEERIYLSSERQN